MTATPPTPARLITVGVLYGLAGFAAGFVMAPVRIMLLEPRIGPVAAVLVEVPVVLTVSFLAARWLVRRFVPGATPAQRAALGTVAFMLLQTAEFGLSLAMGDTPPSYAAKIAAPAGVIGIAAQVLFGLLPLIVNDPREQL
ncbi:MAG TPA: hypothetical protein VD997_08935 [Phycisphaerales bacterium]|nr:hypothetical protein [Phycisphaerales bacterium]